MKKGFLRCAAIAMLMVFLSVGSVFAADDAGKNFIANKVGVGYQGMVAGSFLNGISVRGWIGDRVGLEASGFYGGVKAKIEEGGYGTSDFDADLWIIEAKAMFAVVSRPYSKFYVGGKMGYGQINAKDFGAVDGSSVLTPGVFIGSEWSFPQLPEVGFNFDVGYSWLIYDNKLNEDPYVYMNLSLSGINATFGVHYYF
jgi:hypothetical protein